MGTIEQMAALYALNYHMSCISREGGFIAGANAVLVEIESILNANRVLGHPFPTAEMRLREIEDKIKELKGEQS